MMQDLPERGNEERQGSRASQGSRVCTVLLFGRTVGVSLEEVFGLQLWVCLLEPEWSVHSAAFLRRLGQRC